MFTNWKLFFLIPLFIASNWFNNYQIHIFNNIFNVRTRNLNNIIYWGAQIITGYLLGFLLDTSKLTRCSRGIISLVILFLISMLMWTGTYFIQLGYTREDYEQNLIQFIDFTELKYGSLSLLYFIFGIANALIQLWSYWVLGTQSNNPNNLARYIGFYKAFQSIGEALAWYLNQIGFHFMTQLLINWTLLGISIIPALVVCLTIQDSSPLAYSNRVRGINHTQDYKS